MRVLSSDIYVPVADHADYMTLETEIVNIQSPSTLIEARMAQMEQGQVPFLAWPVPDEEDL